MAAAHSCTPYKTCIGTKACQLFAVHDAEHDFAKETVYSNNWREGVRSNAPVPDGASWFDEFQAVLAHAGSENAFISENIGRSGHGDVVVTGPFGPNVTFHANLPALSRKSWMTTANNEIPMYNGTESTIRVLEWWRNGVPAEQMGINQAIRDDYYVIAAQRINEWDCQPQEDAYLPRQEPSVLNMYQGLTNPPERISPTPENESVIQNTLYSLGVRGDVFFFIDTAKSMFSMDLGRTRAVDGLSPFYAVRCAQTVFDPAGKLGPQTKVGRVVGLTPHEHVLVTKNVDHSDKAVPLLHEVASNTHFAWEDTTYTGQSPSVYPLLNYRKPDYFAPANVGTDKDHLMYESSNPNALFYTKHDVLMGVTPNINYKDSKLANNNTFTLVQRGVDIGGITTMKYILTKQEHAEATRGTDANNVYSTINALQATITKAVQEDAGLVKNIIQRVRVGTISDDIQQATVGTISDDIFAPATMFDVGAHTLIKRLGDAGQALITLENSIKLQTNKETVPETPEVIRPLTTNGQHAFCSYDRLAVAAALLYNAPIVIYNEGRGTDLAQQGIGGFLIFVKKSLIDPNGRFLELLEDARNSSAYGRSIVELTQKINNANNPAYTHTGGIANVLDRVAGIASNTNVNFQLFLTTYVLLLPVFAVLNSNGAGNLIVPGVIDLAGPAPGVPMIDLFSSLDVFISNMNVTWEVEMRRLLVEFVGVLTPYIDIGLLQTTEVTSAYSEAFGGLLDMQKLTITIANIGVWIDTVSNVNNFHGSSNPERVSTIELFQYFGWYLKTYADPESPQLNIDNLSKLNDIFNRMLGHYKNYERRLNSIVVALEKVGQQLSPHMTITRRAGPLLFRSSVTHELLAEIGAAIGPDGDVANLMKLLSKTKVRSAISKTSLFGPIQSARLKPELIASRFGLDVIRLVLTSPLPEYIINKFIETYRGFWDSYILETNRYIGSAVEANKPMLAATYKKIPDTFITKIIQPPYANTYTDRLATVLTDRLHGQIGGGGKKQTGGGLYNPHLIPTILDAAIKIESTQFNVPNTPLGFEKPAIEHMFFMKCDAQKQIIEPTLLSLVQVSQLSPQYILSSVAELEDELEAYLTYMLVCKSLNNLNGPYAGPYWYTVPGSPIVPFTPEQNVNCDFLLEAIASEAHSSYVETQIALADPSIRQDYDIRQIHQDYDIRQEAILQTNLEQQMTELDSILNLASSGDIVSLGTHNSVFARHPPLNILYKYVTIVQNIIRAGQIEAESEGAVDPYYVLNYVQRGLGFDLTQVDLTQGLPSIALRELLDAEIAATWLAVRKNPPQFANKFNMLEAELGEVPELFGQFIQARWLPIYAQLEWHMMAIYAANPALGITAFTSTFLLPEPIISIISNVQTEPHAYTIIKTMELITSPMTPVTERIYDQAILHRQLTPSLTSFGQFGQAMIAADELYINRLEQEKINIELSIAFQRVSYLTKLSTMITLPDDHAVVSELRAQADIMYNMLQKMISKMKETKPFITLLDLKENMKQWVMFGDDAVLRSRFKEYAIIPPYDNSSPWAIEWGNTLKNITEVMTSPDFDVKRYLADDEPRPAGNRKSGHNKPLARVPRQTQLLGKDTGRPTQQKKRTPQKFRLSNPFIRGGSKKPRTRRRPRQRQQTKRSKQHKKRRTLRHRRRRHQTRHT